MSAYGGSYQVSSGLDRLADKLRKAANAAQAGQAISKAVVETTMLAQENIAERITTDIEPHNRDGKIVTDLVDTGAYRASWTTQFPSPTEGELSTNIEYGAVLEYGTQDGSRAAFYPAQDTAEAMRPVFKEKAERAVRSLYE